MPAGTPALLSAPAAFDAAYFTLLISIGLPSESGDLRAHLIGSEDFRWLLLLRLRFIRIT